MIKKITKIEFWRQTVGAQDYSLEIVYLREIIWYKTEFATFTFLLRATS